MFNHQKGYHQFIKQKKHHVDTRSFKKFYDKFIYLVIIIAPFTHIPQITEVFIHKDASGVSALSWMFFGLVSVSWLIYGILHKDRHIAMLNSILLFIQFGIAIGAVIYG